MSEHNTTKDFILLLLIFLFSIISLIFVYSSFPDLDSNDSAKVKLPKSIEDAKDLGRVLSKYTDEYYTQVILSYAVTFVFLQSFAIPGSIFLSILSGYLFPFPLALFLVCACSSVGASLCYLISSLVGRKLVNRYIPDRVQSWAEQVASHHDDIFSYIVFLRITPFLPNWFINITSPILDVPLWAFFIGTFVGVAPPSFGFISAGVELYELTTTGDAFSFKSVLLVILSAVLSLSPILLRKLLERRIVDETSKKTR